jgi:hypothetical protein
MGVSPDVENYYEYHNHKPCAPVEMIKGQAPVAAGESRFRLVTGIVAGGLTAWGVTEALESPSRPGDQQDNARELIRKRETCGLF